MAILQLTLANLHDEINLRVWGSTSPTNSWGDTALTRQINLYLQSLGRKTAQVLQGEGVQIPEGVLHFDMWRTVGALTETSGSSTVHFPVDYDHYISFYDITHGRKLDVIENVDKYYIDQFKWRENTAHGLATRPGPPEAIEILGFEDNGGTWQRKGTIWPATVSGVTPNIRLTYYRLPATVSSDSDEPDIDIKYQELLIYGPILEILRDDDPSYIRYVETEKDLLLGLAKTARAV